MKVIDINDFSEIQKETAGTTGFFDGVHRGHRYLIEQLKDKAALLGLPSSLITFSNHPKKILDKNFQVALLNSFDERIDRLASTGIDYCYVIRFTQAFSEITAEDFIRQVLREQLKLKFLLIGYDHRFGKGRRDTFEHYLTFGRMYGLTVDKAGKLPDDSVSSFSSTTIRHLLQEGEVKKAAGMLAYNYPLVGIVIAGDRVGRTIGFPTANIELIEKEKLIPKEGVYAGCVSLDGKKYDGMVYIGRRPTLSLQGESRIEVHILDFNENIYGKRICVELIDFLRPDRFFHNLNDLQKQLEKDKESVRHLK
ncbi:MAG: riboflavin biosynthesis protein RibF [Dysgonamonadaceae bacterium]|jgi:riboflavin kinase/FMN adenylyltransferase|nr:riboflavin biosynthesis protein RibF [Dysgonamonadaceae bacterium]